MTAPVEVEIQFPSWGELARVLAHVNLNGWIFRGLQDYDYRPVSSLERALAAAGIHPSNWRDRENLALAFFKERARLHTVDTPADDDLLGWWGLMQHYGAPTRLVDWTVSPFVACYFACEQISQSGQDGALWMLNALDCRGVLGSKFLFGRDHTGTIPTITTNADGSETKSYAGRGITQEDEARDENFLLREAIEKEADWPLPLPILRPDRRMAAQQACFVCSGRLGADPSAVELLMLPKTREEIAARYSAIDARMRYMMMGGDVLLFPKEDGSGGLDAKSKFEFPGMIVKKVRIPNSWRGSVLASLSRMNINAESLFPGLDGLGRATGTYLQTGAPASIREYLGL